MALKIKRSGGWYDVAPGTLKIRYGGAWVTATGCSVRYQGAWKPSGYVAYPGAPTNLVVSPGGQPYNWSFTNVTLQWTAPTYGAPVKWYRVVKTDANGNWTFTTTTTGTSHNFGVSQDERCKFYVEAVSYADLTSGAYYGWTGPVQVQIGHPEVGHYADVQHSETWNSALMNVNMYVGGGAYVAAIFVPGDVLVSSWYTNLRADAAWAKLSPDPNGYAPPSGRRMFDVFRNAPQWANPANRLDVPNPWAPGGNGWRAMSHWGENTGWGYAIDGTGYGTSPTSSMRVYGEFQIWGTRYWNVNTYFMDTPYQGNSFW